ncbi:hypothetical protein HNY73_010203 [Argiope bruennichi]|uniref:Uncharacterized protein n=1 Tax=Argiope bruennichi TaxID=94029 RepID=A0A8T0F533_ARGBR|nr:hypothetical protein HNY73_010203 [Argiope bruennichi]
MLLIYAWTDSQVVLSWLSSPPRNWKPFVANRTSEILDLIPQNRWRYVPSKENPADIGSRGLSPKDLPDCRLWWEGPTFLTSSEADWPKQPVFKNNDSVLKEKKKTACVFAAILKNDLIDSLIEKYSSYTKLINVLCFCIRFINNCKTGKVNNSTGIIEPITSKERIFARNIIVKYVQTVFFDAEINCIRSNQIMPKKSPLSALCPFIDKDGLLRVGGRLQNASLQYNAKHPIILPNQHKLSILIVQYFHILNLHACGNLLMGNFSFDVIRRYMAKT